MSQIDTPLAFLVFRRPQTTARVWEAIRQARPKTLLIVADGPRATHTGETELCAQVRAICDRVDWPCEVLRNYAETNLGCRQRVSSGLDWVFQTVEEAIILEDDCLPHPTFFSYCQELLERYRYDERVMLISGANVEPGPPRTKHSYYFSRYPLIWGWATWRRAWRHYDVDMSLWPIVRDGGWLVDILDRPESVAYWTDIFERVASGRIDTWDYQVTLACWCQHALALLPRRNLVSNIGFGADATHTVAENSLADLPVEPMSFPLDHPPCILPDARADERTRQILFSVVKKRRPTLRRSFRKFCHALLKERPISQRQWLALQVEVDRVCQADNEVLADTAIERLPSLQGFLPGSQQNGIVFAGCDEVYLRRFAIDLAHSARAHSPEQAVHLHVCDPSPDSLVLLEQLKENQRGPGFSFTWEQADIGWLAAGMTRGYYYNYVRFVRLWQVLDASRSPVLCLDADSIIRRSLSSVFKVHSRVDLALFCRPKENDVHLKVLAAALLPLPTALGRRFMRDFSAVLVGLLQREAFTYMDTIVLYSVWSWYRKNVPEFIHGNFTRNVSDSRKSERSAVWHAKGKLK